MFNLVIHVNNALDRIYFKRNLYHVLRSSIIALPHLIEMSKQFLNGIKTLTKKKTTSLFCHFLWIEAGKHVNGFIYDIMQKTRHQYHYAVRKLDIQKQQLSENISNTKDFWIELMQQGITKLMKTC